MQWDAASDDWHTTNVALDLRVGGAFSYRMEAKDGSVGFDLTGTYSKIAEGEPLEFSLDDARVVQVEFVGEENGVRIRETFDTESTCSHEQQRAGWQAILDRFARHVESQAVNRPRGKCKLIERSSNHENESGRLVRNLRAESVARQGIL